MHKIVATFRMFMMRSWISDARWAYSDTAALTKMAAHREEEEAGIEEGLSACPIDAMLSVIDGRWMGRFFGGFPMAPCAPVNCAGAFPI
jgi:hypothetical protein